MAKLRVAVLFGGRSKEHEVSLMSAKSIMEALDRSVYDVIPIGITKDGVWLIGDDPLSALKNGGHDPLPDGVAPAVFIADPRNPGWAALEGSKPIQNPIHDIDIVFPVLHGPFGEDGTIQGLLEVAGLPYVGCGVVASAVGMDKAQMRSAFKANDLPLLDWVVVLRHQLDHDLSEITRRIETELGYPCFVKPANLGSSVGVSKATGPEELVAGLKEAARFDRKIIIEKGAVGWKEVECSVLGNDNPMASIPGEIVPGGDFYDYQAKYIDDTSELIIPARISEKTVQRVQELSVKAFQAVDGAGLARVDFFVHPSTEEVVINEINTMPGFTPISMYPKLWDATGISYSQLVDRLVQLGLQRWQDVRQSV